MSTTAHHVVKPIARHTAGPWRWQLNERNKRITLFGQDFLVVFDCERWGMRNASIRLRDEQCLMHRAEAFGSEVPGREHHADWFKTIDHPDARLIASAPDHVLIARLLCEQTLRWEPFGDGRYGELCFKGIRHSTKLDEFGVPAMTDHLRAEIARSGL